MVTFYSLKSRKCIDDERIKKPNISKILHIKFRSQPLRKLCQIFYFLMDVAQFYCSHGHPIETIY